MKKRLYLLAGMAAVLCLVGVLMQLTGVTCPIQWLTGISCPGCGMTRACLSLLLGIRFAGGPNAAAGFGGHIYTAWYYHPLVFVVPPAILYILLGRRPLLGSKRREHAFILALCLLMIGVYAVRLARQDPVLQFNWHEGLIAHMLNRLLWR